MKKRILLSMIAVLMTFSLILGGTACKQDAGKTDPAQTTQPTQTTAPVGGVGKLGDNSFENEDDLVGWIGRGEGTVVVSKSDKVAHEGTYSLFTEGRTSDWNGPGCEYPFVGGSTYELTLWVYQESGSDKTMILSAEVTINGTPGYQNVHRTDVPSGTWTKLTGTFRAGENAEKTVIYVETLNAPAMTFYIDSVHIADKASVELGTDLPSLKDVYKDDFPVGCALPLSAFADTKLLEFLKNQYNTFTHENELKPENVLDLVESKARADAGDETHPAVNIDKARPLLDFAKENGFVLNGHVLLWHQQTPEAFFRKGYDLNGEFADKETMLLRMENYISAVFDAVYKDYPGVVTSWDVVNEAVSDSTGKLRTSRVDDPENGSFWMDTVGPEYVEKAFTYARKYAPDGVKLVYNDYSVPYEPKLSGIVELVAALDEKDLIDAVGLQAHYQMSSPAVDQIQNAMNKFIDLGLSIRITELDIEALNNSDEEMMKQAKRYASLMSLFSEYSDHVDAVIIWGISDGTSWKADKYPMLFDTDMQPKLAFWALTDPSKLPPETLSAKSYGPRTPSDVDFGRATAYAFGNNSFSSLYDDDKIYVRVIVKDATKDDSDNVTVFFADDVYTVKRSEATETDNGYIANIVIDREGKNDKKNPFDVLVLDNGAPAAWNDKVNTEKTRNMGTLSFDEMPDCAVASYGKPNMTGTKIDAIWNDVPSFLADKSNLGGADEDGKVNVEFKVMWQEDMLYVLLTVTDPHLDDSSETSYEQDSVEIFLDEGNHRNGAYEGDDGQYRLNFNNVLNIDHGAVTPVTRTIKTKTGFVAEMAIPLTTVASDGQIMGFDVRYNNKTASGERKLLNFWDTTDNGWQNTAVFGLLELEKSEE